MSRASRPRPSAEDLELELAALERTLPPPERRVSRPADPRRSVPELLAELERLSADIPLRDSTPAVRPVPQPVKPAASARTETSPVATREPAATRPSVPPNADDFDEVPAVLGVLDADGRLRLAITPPPPPPAGTTPSIRPARRPSIPPPIPEAARRMSIPAPIAPTPIANDDSTMMMQLDASLLEEIDSGELEDVSEEGMREPTPSPLQLENGQLPSIPRAPAVPVQARVQHDSLPDLSDLGDMLEPSAAPPEQPTGDTDRPAAEHDE
jgi:hypothetical protein